MKYHFIAMLLLAATIVATVAEQTNSKEQLHNEGLQLKEDFGCMSYWYKHEQP